MYWILELTINNLLIITYSTTLNWSYLNPKDRNIGLQLCLNHIGKFNQIKVIYILNTTIGGQHKQSEPSPKNKTHSVFNDIMGDKFGGFSLVDLGYV